MEIKYMKMALKEAQKAFDVDEVPIGAVIVQGGKVVAKAHNLVEKTNIATSHAEIIAINKACKKLNSWRLLDADMYVTVEPCAMCAGAIVNARIKNVFFGTAEHKSGCAKSLFPILSDNGLNHKTNFIGGIMEQESKTLLKNYFKGKRALKNLD